MGTADQGSSFIYPLTGNRFTGFIQFNLPDPDNKSRPDPSIPYRFAPDALLHPRRTETGT